MVPRMRQRVVEPLFGLGTPTWVTVGRLRPVPACPPGQAARPRLDAPAPRRGAGLRRRPVRPGPPAVGSAAGGGPGRRPGRVPGQEPPQRDRRARRGPADHPAAQPHARARPATGPSRRCPRPATGVADRAVHRAGRRRAPGPRRRRRCARASRRSARCGGRGRAASQAAGQAVEAARCAGPHGRARPARLARCWPGAAAAGTSRSLDVPLADLKAGAKAAGGSLNDGLLAAVIGGFRRYHERHGAPVGPAHRRVPDQPAHPGRPAGRQPLHRRQVRRGHGRDATRPPGSPPCGSSC